VSVGDLPGELRAAPARESAHEEHVQPIAGVLGLGDEAVLEQIDVVGQARRS
jgi:hypothetical protein